jgi:hypothetical protein
MRLSGHQLQHQRMQDQRSPCRRLRAKALQLQNLAPIVKVGEVWAAVRLRFRFASATPDTLRILGLAWPRHARLRPSGFAEAAFATTGLA